MSNELMEALGSRQREYTDAINQIRVLASREAENEVYEKTALLREAIELVGCLRRLLPGMSVAEIHKAFGAPGDFGYETPVGIALMHLYRGAHGG